MDSETDFVQAESVFLTKEKLYLDYMELLEYNIEGFFVERGQNDIIGSI